MGKTDKRPFSFFQWISKKCNMIIKNNYYLVLLYTHSNYMTVETT